MVSIAIPSSVVENSSTYSLEQATYTLYQIARACIYFKVSEIVIYDTSVPEPTQSVEKVESNQPKKIRLDEEPAEKGPDAVTSDKKSHQSNPSLVFTANMLQYLITPPYLRKLIFKPIGNLNQFKHAKRLPRIPGLIENKRIIQGIAMPREKKRKLPGQKKLTKKDRKDATVTPYVNVGFSRLFKLKNDATVKTHSQVYLDTAKGEVVKTPVEGTGFSVRAVSQFSQIFTQSTVPDGYSQTIFIPCQQFKSQKAAKPLIQEVSLRELRNTEKVLLLFGSWPEVQSSVLNDEELEINDASALFDGVTSGAENIRLEDSVSTSLARI